MDGDLADSADRAGNHRGHDGPLSSLLPLTLFNHRPQPSHPGRVRPNFLTNLVSHSDHVAGAQGANLSGDIRSKKIGDAQALDEPTTPKGDRLLDSVGLNDSATFEVSQFPPLPPAASGEDATLHDGPPSPKPNAIQKPATATPSRQRPSSPWWKAMLASPVQAFQGNWLFGKPSLEQTMDMGGLPDSPTSRPVHRKKGGLLKVRRLDLPNRYDKRKVTKHSLKNVVAKVKFVANSSKKSKDSKRKAVKEILKAACASHLPLTAQKIKLLAGALKHSGYKSGHTYIIEAKVMHVEGGWDWSAMLDRTFKL